MLIRPSRTTTVATLLQWAHTCIHKGRSPSGGFVTPMFCRHILWIENLSLKEKATEVMHYQLLEKGQRFRLSPRGGCALKESLLLPCCQAHLLLKTIFTTVSTPQGQTKRVLTGFICLICCNFFNHLFILC